MANAGQVFANLPHAAAKEQLDARHMNAALWQATWGYFLAQMLAGSDAGGTYREASHRWQLVGDREHPIVIGAAID